MHRCYTVGIIRLRFYSHCFLFARSVLRRPASSPRLVLPCRGFTATVSFFADQLILCASRVTGYDVRQFQWRDVHHSGRPVQRHMVEHFRGQLFPVLDDLIFDVFLVFFRAVRMAPDTHHLQNAPF